MKCAIPRTVRRMGDFGEEVVQGGECGGTLTVYDDRGHYIVACARCHHIVDPQRLLTVVDGLIADRGRLTEALERILRCTDDHEAERVARTALGEQGGK